MNFWNRLPDPFWMEFLSATLLVAWGTWLITFAPTAFTVDPAYILLRELGNEIPWAITAITCGIGQFVATVTRNRAGRAALACCSGVFWAFITAGLYQLDHRLPRIVLYGGYSTMNGITMMLVLRRIHPPDRI